MSERNIGAAVGCARSTVQACLQKASEAGLCWPLPEELDEAVLQARLYKDVPSVTTRPQPDFSKVHTELSRPGVTRCLLWQEYKAQHPEGWQYSVFCDCYRRWLSTQDPVLRQEHAPGGKLFVDYAGQTVPVIDRYTGEARAAQIFVGTLGCSNFTFAEEDATCVESSEVMCGTPTVLEHTCCWKKTHREPGPKNQASEPAPGFRLCAPRIVLFRVLFASQSATSSLLIKL